MNEFVPAADAASTPVEPSVSKRPWTEGPWEIDGRTVYVLTETGRYQRGEPLMTNRFSAYVQSGVASDAELTATARLMAAAPDLFEVAEAPVVHILEEDEEFVRLSIGGVLVARHFNGSPEAEALLRFDADQRAAIRKATTETPTGAEPQRGSANQGASEQ